ncbi:putative iron-regulated membrane protein [Variovorax boronicumulans]|uniref:Iron-regulated membrane protein n=1 Tax=Variovorax boronicumulans TaxID=436515 RepID=A0AAW8DUE0_9BURK|nr:PepSY-associated TM helix domain-containing protein [Variovorax boronicumulans]MDP9877824.1 putative iron-regulated membrane protein [Variovorax boronicumulans]MDP9923108.1 putative iron-regulated membrane protein [Variovorax boronicumulans]
MKAQTVKDYLAVHTWVGILCGLVLFVAFYAGAFSMLEAEITRWTQPPAPASSAVSDDGDALAAAFLAAHPDAKGRVRLRWPGADNAQPALAHMERGKDPVWWQLGSDGQLRRMASMPREDDTSGNFVDYLHRKGGLPIPLEVAEPVIGLVSLVYALALVSGVVILLPSLVKDLFYLRLGANLKRMWLDVHNLLGVASLPFHLVIALSAAVFGLHDFVYLAQDKFIYQDGLRATVARDSVPPPKVARADWLPPSEIKRRVVEQAPHFRPAGMDYVMLPAGPVALVGGSDERHFQRASRYGLAFVHLGTGQIYDRSYLPGDSGHASTALLSSLFALHFGSFGGDPVRLLYLLLGLSGALLFYTGNLLWIETRTKRMRHPQAGPGMERPRHVRVVSALTLGVCLGCAAALPATLALAHWLAPVLDAPLGGLDALHQGAYYAILSACIAWAIWRGTDRAARGLLWFTAACNALVPLAVLLSLSPDGMLLGAVCALLTLFFAWLAWRQRCVKSPEKGDSW